MIHNLKNLMRSPRRGVPLTVAAIRMSTIDTVPTADTTILGEQS